MAEDLRQKHSLPGSQKFIYLLNLVQKAEILKCLSMPVSAFHIDCFLPTTYLLPVLLVNEEDSWWPQYPGSDPQYPGSDPITLAVTIAFKCTEGGIA